MALLYFAYGSNMLTERLAARCPGARAEGRATLPGHSIAFAKRGSDGSAKATIVAQADAVTPGALFRLPALDLNVLDRFEGVGRGYDRIDAIEVVTGRGRVTAVSYIATEPERDLRPHDWYLALCIAGAMQHGLGAGVIAALRAEPWADDPDPTRPERQAGIAALEAAGHRDWRALLG